MINLLYPLCSNSRGSVYGDLELRLSLRSVEKYGSNYDQIIIVGKKVDWLNNVEFIEFKDDKEHRFRDRNIYLKILEGFKGMDRFLFMNDDHYLLKDVDCENFEYYFREYDMIETINKMNNKDEYWSGSLSNTREYLISQNKRVKLFDMHCPIIYEKEKFKKVSEVDWSVPNGYGIKSLYSNLNDIEGVFCTDSKIFGSTTPSQMQRIMNNHKFISTSPVIKDEQQEILLKAFPHKSKWEL